MVVVVGIHGGVAGRDRGAVDTDHRVVGMKYKVALVFFPPLFRKKWKGRVRVCWLPCWVCCGPCSFFVGPWWVRRWGFSMTVFVWMCLMVGCIAGEVEKERDGNGDWDRAFGRKCC